MSRLGTTSDFCSPFNNGDVSLENKIKWFKGSGKQPVTWVTLVETSCESELSTVKNLQLTMGDDVSFETKNSVVY